MTKSGDWSKFRSPAAIERLLFFLTLLAGVATIWIPARLPMVDLPQHAALVAEWRELLEGRFPWSDLVQTDYKIAYLLGYASLLPLTYLMSASAAIKLLLTIAFVAFVGLCILLRRELGADKRLDWLFFFGFFGFAWHWGFFTYLCAAPLVILFLILAHRQANLNSVKNQSLLVFVGFLLLLSHGLQFLFAVVIGGIFILLDGEPVLKKVKSYIPYYILAALLIGFLLITRTADSAVEKKILFGESLFWRPIHALFQVSGDRNREWYRIIPSFVAFAMPLALRLRPGSAQAWAPFAVCLAILLFVPYYILDTYYVYQRFGLFLLPFWALAFKAESPERAPNRWSQVRFVVLAISALAAIALHGQRQWTISRHAAGFETLLASAEPNRRALSLVFHQWEDYAPMPALMHYPSWYAAEKGGFVDFNFAYFQTAIVKYRPGQTPAFSKSYGYIPPMEELTGYLPLYDYIFIRGTSEDVKLVLENSGRCQFRLRAEDGPWRLLEKVHCAE
ncbi:hypothetical protein [uncultured Rhodoblastus sp.]|uniref:hypothetical protein n=1 Tax=uncultured Rhodoblastus sp. TaxID=543037 RepID=UPI0025DA7652|nr:hypothetical protein [uncultured Rhodoblastus sp.]